MKSDLVHKIAASIRSSVAYSEWVKRNKGLKCVSCENTSDLECHHAIDLGTEIRSYYKMFGNIQQTRDHIVGRHETDLVEGITLCRGCHNRKHPRMGSFRTDISNADTWCVIPREMWFGINRNPESEELGLVGLQMLLGIGWYILNGYTSKDTLRIEEKVMAGLIGKTTGTSFHKAFLNGIESLVGVGVISLEGDQQRLTENYKKSLSQPWFVPLQDVPTKSLTVLRLKLFLRSHRNKPVSVDRLAKEIGIRMTNKTMVRRAIDRAARQIAWTQASGSDPITFESEKLIAPIHQMREILSETLT